MISWQKINLLRVGPDFPSCRSVRQRQLARFSFFPPALCLGIVGHPFHVGVEVFAGVLQIFKEVEVAADFTFVGWQDMEVTCFEHLVDTRPRVLMVLAVVFVLFGLQSSEAWVSL